MDADIVRVVARDMVAEDDSSVVHASPAEGGPQGVGVYGCGDVGEHVRELWVVPGENWDGEGSMERAGGEHDGGSVRGLADDRVQPDGGVCGWGKGVAQGAEGREGGGVGRRVSRAVRQGAGCGRARVVRQGESCGRRSGSVLLECLNIMNVWGSFALV